MHIIPTDTVYVTIDKEAVKKSGMMMASDSIPDKMVISLAGKRALYKGDLMMLEIISQCNWTRPIYVALTVGSENYMNLGDNFVQEGLANRITPFTTNKPGAKNFDTEKTYNNIMNRYKFGGLSAKGLYLDETVTRMCYTHRNLMATLALQLIAEKKDDKALKVLEKAEKEIPTYNVAHNFRSGTLDIAQAYALLGKDAKAKEVINDLWKTAAQYLEWYMSLNDNRFSQSHNECITQLYVMQRLNRTTEMIDKALAEKQMKQIENYFARYSSRGGQFPQ